MGYINAVIYNGKSETIIIKPTKNLNEVSKKYFDLDGVFKKENTFIVTDNSLCKRKSENVQEYFYNLIENYGYKEMY